LKTCQDIKCRERERGRKQEIVPSLRNEVHPKIETLGLCENVVGETQVASCYLKLTDAACACLLPAAAAFLCRRTGLLAIELNSAACGCSPAILSMAR
jgi:hypothetical protein